MYVNAYIDNCGRAHWGNIACNRHLYSPTDQRDILYYFWDRQSIEIDTSQYMNGHSACVQLRLLRFQILSYMVDCKLEKST